MGGRCYIIEGTPTQAQDRQGTLASATASASASASLSGPAGGGCCCHCGCGSAAASSSHRSAGGVECGGRRRRQAAGCLHTDAAGETGRRPAPSYVHAAMLIAQLRPSRTRCSLFRRRAGSITGLAAARASNHAYSWPNLAYGRQLDDGDERTTGRLHASVRPHLPALAPAPAAMRRRRGTRRSLPLADC